MARKCRDIWMVMGGVDERGNFLGSFETIRNAR